MPCECSTEVCSSFVKTAQELYRWLPQAPQKFAETSEEGLRELLGIFPTSAEDCFSLVCFFGNAIEGFRSAADLPKSSAEDSASSMEV